MFLHYLNNQWLTIKLYYYSQGGELMTDGTKRRIAVSTIAEAEFYADNGFDDIIFASPIVKERISKYVVVVVVVVVVIVIVVVFCLAVLQMVVRHVSYYLPHYLS